MKKLFKVLSLVALALVLTFTFTACSGCSGATGGRFGYFSHDGYYLTSFKVKDIELVDARDILSKSPIAVSSSGSSNGAAAMSLDPGNQSSAPTIDEALVNKYLTKYSGIKYTMTYWTTSDSGSAVKESKTFEENSYDFQNILLANSLQMSSGIYVHNLICYQDLVEYFSSASEEFKAQDDYYLSPFLEKYTYHESAKSCLVMQQHTFVNISASESGGITCSYLQENETLYDDENKVTNFQSSLGMKIQNPAGTQYEGTVIEVEFEWLLKT